MVEFQAADIARIEEMVVKAISELPIRPSQKFTLRLRYALSPKFRSILNEAIEERYLSEHPSADAIDWEEFGKFLEKILPLIFEILIGLI